MVHAINGCMLNVGGITDERSVARFTNRFYRRICLCFLSFANPCSTSISWSYGYYWYLFRLSIFFLVVSSFTSIFQIKGLKRVTQESEKSEKMRFVFRDIHGSEPDKKYFEDSLEFLEKAYGKENLHRMRRSTLMKHPTYAFWICSTYEIWSFKRKRCA